MKCCNKTIELKKGTHPEKGDYVYYHCEVCGTKGLGKDEKQALTDFKNNKPVIEKTKPDVSALPTPPAEPPEQTTTALVTIPKDKTKIIAWASENENALINQSATFIDKPATKRMIDKNTRYVLNLSGTAWNKVWSSPAGQESLTTAFSDALYYGAILGEMGDLVPYGECAEFIPSVECYQHALETGKNAPFEDIRITIVHKNDQTRNGQEDGNFVFNISRGIPRGPVVGVVVEATRTDNGKRIGEIYDAERLIDKAFEHSPGYRQYRIDKDDFERVRASGGLKKDKTGREYIEKEIPKKDGTTWNKKIYEYDLKNPYAGADQAEMLRKAAGKSFFRPYMKVRNAVAMAEEWGANEPKNREDAASDVLKNAAGQFGDGEIVDAEIVEE